MKYNVHGLQLYTNVDEDPHREDGPAVIYSNGQQEWWFNGKRHRSDGPAIIGNGFQEWWLNNNRILNSIVEEWLSEFSINPNWKEWQDEEKVLFRLRF